VLIASLLLPREEQRLTEIAQALIDISRFVHRPFVLDGDNGPHALTLWRDFKHYRNVCILKNAKV
jgi:hypothetical protein